MKNEQHEKVKQLLGCYLDQDWPDEFSSPREAIAAFIRDSKRQVIDETCAELDEVIALIPGMADPESYLWQRLFCYYYPPADGLTVEAWLKEVRAQLSQ